MAIARRTNGTSSAQGTSSASLAAPAGVQIGDVLVAFKTDRATSGTTTAPAGWTRVTSASGTLGRGELFYRVHDANNTGPWSFAGSTRTLVACSTYSGVDTSNPLDVTPTIRRNASGTTGTTGITPETNENMLIGLFGTPVGNYAWSNEATANIAATNWSEAIDVAYSSYVQIAIADYLQTTAAATGNSSATMATTAVNICALVSLRPATLTSVSDTCGVTISAKDTSSATRSITMSSSTGGGTSNYLSDIDGVGTPTVALSLRKVVAGYSGYAIRAWKTGGDTQDIGFNADGSLDTTSLLSFAGSGSAYITRWYRQDGAGGYAEQTDSAKMPRIVNSGAVDVDGSGRANMVFDGTDDYLSLASLALDGLHSSHMLLRVTNLAMVLEHNTNANYGGSYMTSSVYNGYVYRPNVGERGMYGNNYWMPSSAAGVASMIASDTDVKVYSGETEQQTINAWGTGGYAGDIETYDLYIFSRAGASEFAAGYLSELVMFSGQDNTTSLSDIVENMTNAWPPVEGSTEQSASDNRSITIYPTSNSADNKSVTVFTKDAVSDNRSVTVFTKDASSSNRSVIVYPVDSLSDNRSVIIYPKDSIPDSRLVTIYPISSSVDNRSVIIYPKDVVLDNRGIVLSVTAAPDSFTDTRSITIFSKDATSDNRFITVTGKDVLSDNRSINISAKDATANTRSVTVFPKDITSANRSLTIFAKDSLANNRSITIYSISSSIDTRSASILSKDIASDGRLTTIYPKSEASDNRSITITPCTSLSDNRSITITPKSVSSDNRGVTIFIGGAPAENRSITVYSIDVQSGTKGITISAKDIASDTKGISIVSKASGSDARNVTIQSKAALSSDRNITIFSKTSSADSRNIFIESSSLLSDNRDIDISASSTDSDTKAISIISKDTVSDSRIISIEGSENVVDAKILIVYPIDEVTDSRDILVDCSDCGFSQRGIFVVPNDTISDNRGITVNGVIPVDIRYEPHIHHQIIRNHIIAFGNLFDIQLIRESNDSIKVPVSYSAKDKFIERIRIRGNDPTNIRDVFGMTMPRIGFELTGIEYDAERKLNKMHKYAMFNDLNLMDIDPTISSVERMKVEELTKNRIITTFTPVPYVVHFSLYIATNKESDRFSLIETIPVKFRPFINTTVNYVFGPLSFNNDLEYKGRVQLALDEPVTFSGVITHQNMNNVDFTTQDFTITQMDFSMRCHFFREISNEPIIKHYQININIENEEAEPFTQNYFSAPISAPVDINRWYQYFFNDDWQDTNDQESYTILE